MYHRRRRAVTEWSFEVGAARIEPLTYSRLQNNRRPMTAGVSMCQVDGPQADPRSVPTSAELCTSTNTERITIVWVSAAMKDRSTPLPGSTERVTDRVHRLRSPPHLSGVSAIEESGSYTQLARAGNSRGLEVTSRGGGGGEGEGGGGGRKTSKRLIPFRRTVSTPCAPLPPAPSTPSLCLRTR